MRAKRLALVTSIALVAAATALSAAQARPESGKATTTLTLWIMNNGPEPVADMNRILAPFEQQSGINVNVQLVGWDVQYQRITNSAISGEGPDVTQAGTTQVPYFAALNGFENLASRVNRIGGSKAYAPGVWATTQLQGRSGVWSVPWFTEARTIYYRKDVYKRAGVNPKTAFKNWTTFRAALLKLRAVKSVNGKPIMPFGQPGKTAWDLVHHIMPFVWGAGGRELAGSKQSAIASPQAIRGVKYFADLVPSGVFLKSSLEKNAPQVEEQFKGGQIATWIGGPWVLATVNRADDTAWAPEARRNVGVAQMPVGPTGKFFTFVGGSNLMVFKSSSHKEEAFRLIQYLSRDDVQKNYARIMGMFPARLVPQRQEGNRNANAKQFYEAIRHGRTYAPIAGWGPVENAYKTHFGNILDIAAGQGRVRYSRTAVVNELKAAAREANSLLAQAG